MAIIGALLFGIPLLFTSFLTIFIKIVSDEE